MKNRIIWKNTIRLLSYEEVIVYYSDSIIKQNYTL